MKEATPATTPATAPEAPAAAPRVHHPFSPSTLQNREACPCYESTNSENERSIAGTLAHGVAESGVDNADLSDEDALAAAECADFAAGRKQIMEDCRQSVIANAMPGAIPRIREFKEDYLPIDDCKFPDGTVGTTAGYIDHMLIDHTETYAEIFDWKFGRWAVEAADNNLQGIAYSLGAFFRFPKLQKVRFFFKQPHIDSVSEAVFTREQLPKLYLRVQAVVARARLAKESGSFAMANPVVPACNFCGNIGRCPRVLDFACKVGAKFYPIEIPPDITPTMVLDRHNTNLAMRLASVVKTWSEAFRTQVTDRVIRRDADVPDGYYITSQSKRELLDEAKFKEIALRYVEEKEYSDSLKVVFGPVEKAVSSHAPRGQKKATIEQFQSDLDAAGATRRGEPYSFLKLKPSGDSKT